MTVGAPTWLVKAEVVSATFRRQNLLVMDAVCWMSGTLLSNKIAHSLRSVGVMHMLRVGHNPLKEMSVYKFVLDRLEREEGAKGVPTLAARRLLRSRCWSARSRGSTSGGFLT